MFSFGRFASLETVQEGDARRCDDMTSQQLLLQAQLRIRVTLCHIYREVALLRRIRSEEKERSHFYVGRIFEKGTPWSH